MDICICFAGNVACSCKRLPAEQTTSDAFDEGSQSEGCALGDRTPTSFVFMYNEEDLDKIGKVDVDVQGDDIRTILNVCLRNTNLTYVLQDEVIVIKPEVQSQKVKEVRIKGTVKDEKGHLLPGVTVFIKGLQIGTVTDGDGRFTIAIPDMESIVLQFSFVGMLSKEVKYEGQEEIHVVLRETKEELEEVVVTGYANIRKESFTGNATTVTKRSVVKNKQ